MNCVSQRDSQYKLLYKNLLTKFLVLKGKMRELSEKNAELERLVHTLTEEKTKKSADLDALRVVIREELNRNIPAPDARNVAEIESDVNLLDDGKKVNGKYRLLTLANNFVE